MSRLSVAVSALALFGALTSIPVSAVQRTFVASFGSDANTATNCGFANPCRGFTAAMGITDPGGEVVAMDAAGYGAVTITKSITLTANPGYYAGIASSFGYAVTIGTAGVNVILRGLNINGVGASYGAVMNNGSRLSIENCIISNFANDGVIVATAAAVRIIDSIVRDNSQSGIYLAGGATATISGTRVMGNYNGIYVNGNFPGTTTTAAISDSVVSNGYNGVFVAAPTATAVARGSVTHSTLSNNLFGLALDAGAGTQTAIISNSLVTGNTSFGLYVSGGTLKSNGNNTVDQNGTNVSGTITATPGI